MPSRSRGFAASLFITSAMAEFTHDQFHAPLEKRLYTGTSQGCYTSDAGMISQGTSIYQSSGNCGPICYNQQKPVMALFNGNECLCGDLLPSPSSKTLTGNCDQKCNAWSEPCGGTAAYTVWLTGIDDSVGSVEEEPSSSVAPVSSARATSSIVLSYKPVPVPSTSVVVAKATVITSARTEVERPTTIIHGQETIVKTLAPAVQTVAAPASDNQAASSGSSNPIGIAVGVIVGVLVLAAIIVFGIFYARRRRRMKNAENGHARADSLNAFVAQGGTLPGVVANDTRLDPRIMVERRRMSNGSIADNQDYSRRILKVANPSDD